MRATNQQRIIKRRAFIRTTAGSTAGLVLAAGCKSGKTVTRATPNQPTTSVADETSTPPTDTIAPTTTDGTANSATATVWRLSTRNQRSPCGACKAHSAHRFFSSADAAEAGRAHAGCICEVREQPTTVGQLQNWFADGDQVFDDRWT